MEANAREIAATTDSFHHEVDDGKADQTYQFVFSAEGNPQMQPGMNFCNLVCGDGNVSDGGYSNNSRKRALRDRTGGTSKKKPATHASEVDSLVEASLDEAEHLLAYSMTNLSMRDREQALEDVHGVGLNSARTATPSSATTEAPVSSATVLSVHDSINQHSSSNDPRLAEMESLLQQRSNEAYRLAVKQRPEYVKDPTFRLCFLHTFKTPKVAVDKILQFLEIKLQHFGSEALCRDLTMDDLDEGARDCLNQGFYQYLGRDSVGRRVVGTFPMLLKSKDVADVMKFEFYWWTTLFPFWDVDNRGLVAVQYSTNVSDQKFTLNDINLIKAQHNQFCAMPIKYGAWHILLPSRQHNSVAFQVIKLLSSNALNIRTAFHFGNQMEVQYELRRFGINTDPMTFPITLDGEIDHNIHQRFLEHLRSRELSKGNSPQVCISNKTPAGEIHKPGGVMPTDKDILFGRGFTTQHHPGNLTFRRILDKHYQEYTDADNADKVVLVDHLSSQLRKQLGMRFLKVVNTEEEVKSPKKMWVEEHNDKIIRSKMFQAFRNLRASYKRVAEQQQQKQLQQCQD